MDFWHCLRLQPVFQPTEVGKSTIVSVSDCPHYEEVFIKKQDAGPLQEQFCFLAVRQILTLKVWRLADPPRFFLGISCLPWTCSADNLHNPSPIKNNKDTDIVRLSFPNFENASNCMSWFPPESLLDGKILLHAIIGDGLFQLRWNPVPQ